MVEFDLWWDFIFKFFIKPQKNRLKITKFEHFPYQSIIDLKYN